MTILMLEISSEKYLILEPERFVFIYIGIKLY